MLILGWAPGMNITLLLHCQMNLTNEKIGFVNDNDIWDRRKNLTGVTFRVGYRSKHVLIYEKNNVRF